MACSPFKGGGLVELGKSLPLEQGASQLKRDESFDKRRRVVCFFRWTSARGIRSDPILYPLHLPGAEMCFERIALVLITNNPTNKSDVANKFPCAINLSELYAWLKFALPRRRRILAHSRPVQPIPVQTTCLPPGLALPLST